MGKHLELNRSQQIAARAHRADDLCALGPNSSSLFSKHEAR